MLYKPPHDRDGGADAIGCLGKAMSFVRKEDVFYMDTLPTQTLDDLLGLDDWHVGIVGPMQDERRSFHPVDLVNRGERTQEKHWEHSQMSSCICW